MVVEYSGINWTVCKSAHHSRMQITTPAPNHSVFYRPDALGWGARLPIFLSLNTASFINQSRQNVIRNCFGNVYRRVPMRVNSFCGFNSLSYSLTGNQQNYEDIINDCANVFLNTPDRFRTRTNFGARLDSSLAVDNYMVDRVCRGLSADSDAWCEDAHYAAISVLYDTAIFNYSTIAELRYSFNEIATRVCLLSLPGYRNVLHGILQDSPAGWCLLCSSQFGSDDIQ